jgi:hypothetical protein
VYDKTDTRFYSCIIISGLDGHMGQKFSIDPPYIPFLLIIYRLRNKIVSYSITAKQTCKILPVVCVNCINFSSLTEVSIYIATHNLFDIYLMLRMSVA